MKKNRIPVFSIIVYCLAGVLLVYSVWAAFYCANTISMLYAQNQLTFAGNEFEIISYHMTTYAQYVLFAVVLFMAGWILQTLSPNAVEEEFVLEDLAETE